MVVAVDGPAGAGKSTVCRLLARVLAATYLDTGAMYRAVAWALDQKGLSEASDEKIETVLPSLPLEFRVEGNALRIYWEGRPLDDETLRTPRVSRLASALAQRAPVRSHLMEVQRRLARDRDVVVEGRDMTTVVFPDAELKIFLTASPEVRARRRWKEYREKGIEADFRILLKEIEERDRADAERSLAPLRPAEDAVIIDTSEYSIPQVVEKLHRLARNAGKKAAKSGGIQQI